MKNDLRFMNKKKKNHTKSFAFRRTGGFTLVELLMVIIIIGVISMISASSYRKAQIKSRDTERKANLDAVSKSLMMYYNDTGNFPPLNFNNLFGDEDGFRGQNDIIYMRKMPQDPMYPNYEYKYQPSDDFKQFALFANLENKEDPQCKDSNNDYNIGGQDYCYGISSPNTTPEDIANSY